MNYNEWLMLVWSFGILVVGLANATLGFKLSRHQRSRYGLSDTNLPYKTSHICRLGGFRPPILHQLLSSGLWHGSQYNR